MSPSPDLHGIEKQPFPSFDEGMTYLERVTVPDVLDARRLIAAEYNRNLDEIEVEPIHMHWIKDADEAEAKAVPTAWFTESGWYECFDASPGALPFWREVV